MGDESKFGIARGVIELITSRFEQSAKIIQRTSQQMATEVEKVGTSSDKSTKKMEGGLVRVASAFQRAEKTAQEFNKSPLGAIQKGLDAIADKLKYVSLAAGGFVGFGLKTANEIMRLEKQFTVLLGSEQKASNEMARLRKYAAEMKQPFSEVLKTAVQLTPVVKATGVDFEKLLGLTTKLSNFDPAQGAEGARLALNEFFSGSYLSLANRFELGVPREQYAKIMEEANGDANKMIEGLTKILDVVGITDDYVKSMADPFALLGDAVKEAADTAFRPLLVDVVIPLVKQFTDFIKGLRESNPEVLKIGAGISVIVAALAPLSMALSAIISLWKGISVAAAAAGISMGGAGAKLMGAAKFAAGGAVAVGGGALIGGGIAQGIANSDFQRVNQKNALGVQGLDLSTNDLDRIRSKEQGGGGENVMDVLGERIKQLVVIIADVIISFGGIIAKGAAFAGNVLDQFGNAIKLAATVVEEIFAKMQILIGDVLVAAADNLSGLFDTTSLREGGQSSREAGTLTLDGDKNKNIKSLNERRGDLINRLAEGFAVPESKLQEIDTNIQNVKNTVLGGLTDMLFPVEQKAEEVATGLGDAGGTVAGAIGDTEEYLAEQAKNIADSTKTYNDDLAKLETDKQEKLTELNTKYIEDTVKAAQDYAEQQTKTLKDMNDDLTKLATDARREEEKDKRDLQRKAIDANIKFQRDETDAATKQAEKLAKIQSDGQTKQRELAANFDFAGMFALSEDTKTKVDEAAQGFEDQRQERLLALQRESEDMNRDFATQHEERVIAINLARQDRMAQYAQERTDLEAQYATKRAQLATNLTNEITATNTKYAKELAIRQQAYRDELILLMQTEAQRKQIMMQTQQDLLKQAYSFMNRPQPTSQTAPKAPVKVPVTQKQGVNIGGNMKGRAYGGAVNAGQAYRVNEPWSSQMERFASSMGAVGLPGAGAFIPARDGRIDPQRGGNTQTVNVTIQLNAPLDTGILTVAKAIELIQQGAEDAIAQQFAVFANAR